MFIILSQLTKVSGIRWVDVLDIWVSTSSHAPSDRAIGG